MRERKREKKMLPGNNFQVPFYKNYKKEKVEFSSSFVIIKECQIYNFIAGMKMLH